MIMNLKDLMLELEREGYFEKVSDQMNLKYGSTIIYGSDELNPIVNRIKECDEFSDVEKINLLQTPIIHNINGKNETPKTYILKGGEKFKGKAYILSIELSQEFFKDENLHENIKDGASISPKLFNSENFKPTRKILLEYNPDKYKGNELVGNDNLIRQELHDKLDEVLNNPNKYTGNGERSILIRGYFEEIQSPPVKPRSDFYSIIPEPKAYVAFYMEKEVTENGVNAKLRQQIIPAELREEYIKKFDGRGIDVSKEEIDEFLSNYSA